MQKNEKNILMPVVICMIMLAACAPVIETAAYPPAMALMPEKSAPRSGIVLDISRLEKTPETVDPEGLKKAIQEISKSVNTVRDVRVERGSSSAPEANSVEVALTRLDYTKKTIRLPPAPPLGLAILAPLIFPVLLKPDYIRLEITVQADLLFYDGDGRVAKQFFLSESAVGRANFFDFGEEDASAKLKDIAFHNFSRQLMSEFL